MQKAIGGEFTGHKRQVVSCTPAVPAVITAYSTLLILLGHCIFVITINDKADNSSWAGALSEPGFKVVAGIPIILGICMMIGSVVVAELMYHRCVAGEINAPNEQNAPNEKNVQNV